MLCCLFVLLAFRLDGIMFVWRKGWRVGRSGCFAKRREHGRNMAGIWGEYRAVANEEEEGEEDKDKEEKRWGRVNRENSGDENEEENPWGRSEEERSEEENRWGGVKRKGAKERRRKIVGKE